MKSLSAIPTLPGLPLIGHLLNFRNDRLNLFRHVSKRCGDMGLFKIGQRAIILLSTPDLIHRVLVENASDFEKTPGLRVLMRPVLGNGLLSSENEFHKHQRKLMAPVFQHRHIAGYAETMVSEAERAQQGWGDGETIEMFQQMMHITLSIVGKTLFAVDLLSEADEISKALTETMHYTTDRLSSFTPLPLDWPTPRNRRTRQAIARLDATIYRLIEQGRAATEERGDLLSLLLRAHDEDDGSRMSDQQVRDEAMTLFLAGHETTATSLTWTVYLLTQHPASYTKLRQEVSSVLKGRAPTFHDLLNLPYTLQVIKEALRLYPPAYMLGRQATRAIELGGYELPAGTIVAISPYIMHRQANYFPDPERFDPERFTPEAESRLPRFVYMPFGGGPRICIGNHFALMEAQLVLARLTQDVTFELVPGQHIETEPLITLRPKHGIKMRVRRGQPDALSLSSRARIAGL